MKKEFVGAVLVATAACAPPEDIDREVFAVTNAHLYPVARPPIENGTMLVRDGKIVEIGSDISVPRGARTLDVRRSSRASSRATRTWA
ncbi:MAG TPA: hypothetical protein VLK65_08245 [Vicinamibacteria bacterium]|nr:hypothetical protein [Vicinamibacteria bacterium]